MNRPGPGGVAGRPIRGRCRGPGDRIRLRPSGFATRPCAPWTGGRRRMTSSRDPRALAGVLVLILLLLAPASSWGRQGTEPARAEGQGAPRVEAGESFLRWMIRASGPIGLVILGM